MNNELDDLKKRWDGAKRDKHTSATSTDQLVVLAKSKKKTSLYYHYGNITVLFIVMVMVIFFFYVLLPFKEWLSKTGVAMMVGGLLIRIIVEIFSIRKSKKINVGDTALQATGDTLSFYRFRKKIHGTVTILLVGIYIAGYLLLNPELAKYVGWKMMLFWDGIALIAAVILIWQIRKGILKEMKEISEIIELENQLRGDNESN